MFPLMSRNVFRDGTITYGQGKKVLMTGARTITREQGKYMYNSPSEGINHKCWFNCEWISHVGMNNSNDDKRYSYVHLSTKYVSAINESTQGARLIASKQGK